MNAKSTIKKVLFVAVWLCIGGGMLTLLLAAISNRNKEVCKRYEITIKGTQNNFFIDKKDVEALLKKSVNGDINGKLISQFKLHDLEQMLEHNTWIDEAELYFDNRNVLHVTVSEKEPVARVFSTTGNSFYIDSSGRKMPLSDKLSARLPVFTGFPEVKKMNGADSLLLNQVRHIATYVLNDPFWASQVSQIDINTDRNFELIPVIGNHVVKLGSGDEIDQKLHRLMVFYKQVLSKTGFDKYKVIDVQYKGQVVASRYAGDPKVDSIQLRKNVAQLLKQSLEAEADTVIKALPIVRLEADTTDSDPSLDQKEFNPEKSNNLTPLKASLSKQPQVIKPVANDKPKQTVRTKPVPVKIDQPKSEPKKSDPKKAEPKKREPKAVMPKKPVGETEYGGYN